MRLQLTLNGTLHEGVCSLDVCCLFYFVLCYSLLATTLYTRLMHIHLQEVRDFSYFTLWTDGCSNDM